MSWAIPRKSVASSASWASPAVPLSRSARAASCSSRSARIRQAASPVGQHVEGRLHDLERRPGQHPGPVRPQRQGGQDTAKRPPAGQPVWHGHSPCTARRRHGPGPVHRIQGRGAGGTGHGPAGHRARLLHRQHGAARHRPGARLYWSTYGFVDLDSLCITASPELKAADTRPPECSWILPVRLVLMSLRGRRAGVKTANLPNP